ncbi:hypothetical protein SPB21_35585 [Leptothoe sp. ISB3NOV94-8A]|nr:hypothetical protein [Adonisia turfae]MDV3351900.1 hypothetical protein [Leptothoe sp. LEGE 181152]
MKNSMETIVVKRYLQLFGHVSMALVVRCLESSNVPTIMGGTMAKAISGAGLDRFAFSEIGHSLIGDDLNRPELTRYRRSGGCRRLAMLPT